MNDAKESLRTRAAIAMRNAYKRAKIILHTDVWDVELGAFSGIKRLGIKLLRIIQLVGGGFISDECSLHASSLTFISLLAIVPVLALSLSMARVFGAGDFARVEIKAAARQWLSPVQTDATPRTTASMPPDPVDTNIVTMPDNMTTDADETDDVDTVVCTKPQADEPVSISKIEGMIDSAFDRIDKLNFKALGGIGLIFLLWSVIEVLGHVESAFNRVWGIREQRTLWRKFTDYMSVILVVPLLITAASYIPAADMLAKVLDNTGMHAAEIPAVGEKILKLGGSVFLLSFMFSFMLRFLPNTRVRTGPGLAGGFVTAVASLAWLTLCARFQVGVAKYSAFFGGFATVPILLSWVYVSWEILLFGAEVSFAVQNADTYRMEQGSNKASVRTRLIAAVDLMSEAAKSLASGDGILILSDYIAKKKVSVRLINDVVRDLVEHGFLAETSDENPSFAIRRDTGTLTVAEIVKTLIDSGVQPQSVGYRHTESSPMNGSFDKDLDKILPMTIDSINQIGNA